MSTFQLYRGDALDVLRTLPDNSVDSIVTDPPYGIKFMGRRWDYDLPAVAVWVECLRILKPGGHLLAFASTRTHHRMCSRIEDAGFEIRDMLAWVYGSGFPKSMDVSKAIDKAAGAERRVVGKRTDGRYAHGFSEQAKKALGAVVAGESETGFSGEMGLITEPATAAAAEWQGWGTALKPALEPITLARKPLEHKTVVANVLAHRNGALNIDACRVPLVDAADAAEFANNHAVTERLPERYDGEPLGMHDGGWKQRVGPATVPTGRWPANLIHDGSEDVLSVFPQSGGQQGVTGKRKQGSVYGTVTANGEGVEPRGDEGSAARFFYCAKATTRDRNEGLPDGMKNRHPTVKPTDLIRYLQRLVTPPGGTTLDPFVGSGTHGKAAMLEGFDFIGIDSDTDEHGNLLGYLDVSRARILAAGGIEVVDGQARPPAGSPLARLLDTIRAPAVSTNGSSDEDETL